MAAPAIEYLAFLEQIVVVEIGRVAAAGAESQIEAALQHRPLDLRRSGHLDADLHFGRPQIEARDRVMQPTSGIVDEVVDDTHGEVADKATARSARFRPEFLDRGKQALAGLIDELALLRQAESRSPALAKPQTQPMLQRRHVRADRRLADIELDLRGGKAAGLHDFGENAQQSKITLAQIGEHAVPHNQRRLPKGHPEVCPCALQGLIAETDERLTPTRKQ